MVSKSKELCAQCQVKTRGKKALDWTGKRGKQKMFVVWLLIYNETI
jgi:hypothetical protein